MGGSSLGFGPFCCITEVDSISTSALSCRICGWFAGFCLETSAAEDLDGLRAQKAGLSRGMVSRYLRRGHLCRSLLLFVVVVLWLPMPVTSFFGCVSVFSSPLVFDVTESLLRPFGFQMAVQ